MRNDLRTTSRDRIAAPASKCAGESSFFPRGEIVMLVPMHSHSLPARGRRSSPDAGYGWSQGDALAAKCLRCSGVASGKPQIGQR